MTKIEKYLGQLGYTIADAVSVTGIGRTSLYKAIAEGRLRAVKNGRRTLILADDLERFLSHLQPMETANAEAA